MSEKPKEWGLTRKQRDYADSLIETGNPVESAIRAYSPKDRNAARVIAYRNQRNFKIQAYVEATLMLSGTVDKSVQALDDGLSATVIYKGEVTDIPDHKVRLKASKQTLDLVVPKNADTVVEAQIEEPEIELPEDTPVPVLEWIVEHEKLPTEEQEKQIMENAEAEKL